MQPDDRMPRKSVQKSPKALWDGVGLAFLGAIGGILFGIAEELYDSFINPRRDGVPFAKMILELIAWAALGALLLGGVAWLRNRWMTRRAHSEPR